MLRQPDHAGSCEFGAEQAILVASGATKRELQARVGSRALVLTVLESKGLEFQVLAPMNRVASIGASFALLSDLQCCQIADICDHYASLAHAIFCRCGVVTVPL